MKRFIAVLITLFLLCQYVPVALSANIEPSSEKQSEAFTGLIISWEDRADGASKLWIRTREVKNNEWTPWYELKADGDGDEKDGTGYKVQGTGEHETMFSTNLSSEYEYLAKDGVKNVRIEKILSADRAALAEAKRAKAAYAAARSLNNATEGRSLAPGESQLIASLNIPKTFHVISRAEWGANENITYKNVPPQNNGSGSEGSSDAAEKSEITEEDPEIKNIVTKDSSGKELVWPLEYAKDIKFMVIHHSASVSNLDNPKTAIQNTAYYHAVRRGWGDIGYNYIIDTQGNVYEGRKGGDGVISGHAKPLNKVSIGIAVLGNYQQEELPAAVLKNLMALVNEKAKLYDINVDGTTEYKGKIYNNVQGHSENTATLCPGKFLKQKLDGIQELIAYHQTKEKKATPAKYSFKDFEKRNVIVAAPDTKKKFTIRLKNTGEITWKKKNTFLEIKLPKILAQMQSPKVAPGNIGVFEGEVPQTLISGLQIPEASLVINGTIRPEKEIPVPIMVEGLRTTYEIVGRKDPPATLKSGKKATAWIILKNTGNITWRKTGDNRVMMGTSRPQDRKSGLFSGKRRIARLTEREVKPGETGKFQFSFIAPKTPGTYTEYFQPLIEGVTWMADSGMHFTVEVKGKEKPLRVALSFEGKPKIRSANGMKLYEDTKLIYEFGPGEIARTARLKAGGYRVTSGDKKFTLHAPPRFKPKAESTSAAGPAVLEIVNFENRPAWNQSLNDNLFRGILEIRSVDGKLKVINELPLEDYLRGVAEISNGDPKEKIKTIMILARSYAKYYRDIGRKFPGKPYDLDDDPDHTQKYVGFGFELRSPNVIAAIEETTGQIVTYQGKPVLTPYFNQSDGRTRSAEEVWGWKNAPYLISVTDTFCGTTQLKGHGVGLSGCGATELAKKGGTAEEIIKYYMPGIEITGEK